MDNPGGVIVLVVATAIFGPLIIYPLIGIPGTILIAAWVLIQMGTETLCRRMNWRVPCWAAFKEVPQF